MAGVRRGWAKGDGVLHLYSPDQYFIRIEQGRANSEGEAKNSLQSRFLQRQGMLSEVCACQFRRWWFPPRRVAQALFYIIARLTN